jgi:hypothetical protein
MSKKRGGGKNSPALPGEVQRLIARKLQQQQREQEILLVSANQAAYSKLHEEVKANIHARRLGRAFITAPLAVYREVVANATAATKEWPGVVWGTIAPLLERAPVTLPDGVALNKLVDEYAWAVNQHPFTLSVIDPERFKGLVRREAGRYGVNQPEDLASFDRQLEHAATAAQCGIVNTANQAREKIGIAIDEYLLAQRQIPRKVPPTLKLKAGGAHADCLPNPPKKVDDWFLAIKDMTLAFHRKHRRCPNEAEAWAMLRTNPPDTYGITSGKHHGEQAVLMHGRALGKRSFSDRWRRYTRANLRIKPQ